MECDLINRAARVEVDRGRDCRFLGGNSYSQGGADFTVAFGGTGPGQSGQLATSGSATLNGPLDLRTGFSPRRQQSISDTLL